MSFPRNFAFQETMYKADQKAGSIKTSLEKRVGIVSFRLTPVFRQFPTDTCTPPPEFTPDFELHFQNLTFCLMPESQKVIVIKKFIR